jgi:HicB family
MELTPYVISLRAELANAAGLGGDEARALAERLTAPMESAFRLALLEALSAAADEITLELAPGSVELKLRGREPGFLVTLPAAEQPVAAPVPAPAEPDDGSMTRINLRLSDQLKGRIEEAAARDGLSVNAWLVRAAAAATQSPDPAREARHAPQGGQRFTGWAR